MATIEAALTAALTAEATVSALVGTRVFPVGGRQGATYPYVVWQKISTQGEPYLDGPSNLDHPRFQIDIYATSALDALTAAEAIRTFLDCQQRSGAGLSFYATFQDGRSDFDLETGNFRASQDYFIWYGRS
jgi:Protein of unknown function (DUF3168)